MNFFIPLLLSVYLLSSTGNKNTPIHDKTRAHLPEVFATFEQVLSRLPAYPKDTLTAIEFPGEGGEVVVYHSGKENLLIQAVLYGEMGKINYFYLVDNQMRHQLTKVTQYNYDKPMYMDNIKMDSTIQYISYLPEVNYFDSNLILIKDNSIALELKSTSESLFKEIISQADLRK